MNKQEFETLHDLFYPRNVAVVGASTNPVKLGFQALLALKTGGLAGKIFPVSPSLKDQTVMEMPGYGSIEEIPEDAQLFVLAVPHSKIEGALVSAAKKGAKGAVIFAGGFREIGGEGVGAAGAGQGDGRPIRHQDRRAQLCGGAQPAFRPQRHLRLAALP